VRFASISQSGTRRDPDLGGVRYLLLWRAAD